MKKSINLWSLWAFAAVSVMGTLLHFLYDFSGRSVFAAPFSGVNESTWEHMKLLFFPMFVFALIQSLFFRDRGDFFCIKLRGILLGQLLIPVIFYTYNGTFGRSPDFVNIAIFFISAAAAYFYEARKFEKRDLAWCPQRFSLAIIVLIGALFAIFTFYPPRLPLFSDPLTGTFGIG
ncbi:MAG: hypothetical protein IKM46_00910 [Clostridia bacterium]|nr:hypothetical protein [Clostridia bacterium]